MQLGTRENYGGTRVAGERGFLLTRATVIGVSYNCTGTFYTKRDADQANSHAERKKDLGLRHILFDVLCDS